MKNGICPKCQSNKIVRDVLKINPPSSPLLVKGELTVDNSKGLNAKSTESYICCNCGFTEIYVINPASLWKKHGEKSDDGA